MLQSVFTAEDRRFEQCLDYQEMMVEEGMESPEFLPELCASCLDECFIKRPAMYGELYCRRCWQGDWDD